MKYPDKLQYEIPWYYSDIQIKELLSIYHPCTRCGICCCIELCKYGKTNEKDICKFLIIGIKKCSCLLVTQKTITPASISINTGTGCQLKKIPECYKYCAKLAYSKYKSNHFKITEKNK